MLLINRQRPTNASQTANQYSVQADEYLKKNFFKGLSLKYV